ncbi:hypothetical protein AMS68_005753 [Peltaster fructicola]|uniref:R3H domain-containing protein n=1 Tax=Peltaster fructicola TaxID=286661 RepID=A0A6H0XZX2_9PEZI|nr:hypothetical protein AMS68_005753 [Peltaster fructicola]
MEKRCMCGKKSLKNQQCWLQDIRCGEICGKKLRCGSHFCRKPCHRPGDCEDSNGQQCRQPCGKEKKVCGHPDDRPCHAPFACEEDKPCQSKIFITCDCQAQKQEAKCGASKTSDGNNGKKLSCNEECARLERNRKLALALNIDRTAHVDGGDHIPYSAETLAFFAKHVKWAQTQEREFRVFATSDEEKRMRFKPMKQSERAFLHHLADDFGFDSESMDPEPHRHVMVWKTPRFVSAPNKTLAEALRIRMSQRAIVSSAPASDSESAKRAVQRSSSEPYNGYLITRPRFGLMIDELRSELHSALPASLGLSFDIEFLPSEEVVMKATGLPAQELQQDLIDLKPAVATAITAKQLGLVQLCSADASLNILRRESDSLAAQDGWSRVAAKKSAPKTVLQGASSTGMNNQFAVLTGNKVTFSAKKPAVVKRRPVQEEVVDDWESAVREEEEKAQTDKENGEEQHHDGRSTVSEASAGDVAVPPLAQTTSTSEENVTDALHETSV